ncbi:hypothetical protein [Halobacillus sp. HZG1]|uniref:hypothetical protein n=1 Tax=Halobacillus sp. HZG1 TaxID=3111769 RepID=UPI002DBA8D15|nr:hypothetical protein [Halobacillus sp. HZG1]
MKSTFRCCSAYASRVYQGDSAFGHFPMGEWRASSGYALRDLADLLSPTGVSQLPNHPIRLLLETNPFAQYECLSQILNQ